MQFFQSEKLLLILAVSFLLIFITPAGAMVADDQKPEADTTVYLPLTLYNSTGIAPIGTLINDGTLIGPEGIQVGALGDSLSQPVGITIALTNPPTVTMPSQANPIGNFYHIGAVTNTFTSYASPLLIGFPVPPGTMTDTLAAAVLQSNISVADAQDIPQSWSYLEGEYDPTNNLFITTVTGLAESGRTFVLSHHPDFGAPTILERHTSSQVSTLALDLFNVKCVNFSTAGDCTDMTETTISGYLFDIYQHFVNDLGFNEPRIRNLAEKLEFNPNSLASLGFTVYIEPFDFGFCASEPAAGYYDRDLGRLVLCYNPAIGINDDTLDTLIHEYFHTTEYAYPEFLNDYKNGHKDENWLVEGMAMSAEESYFVSPMKRSNNENWIQLHKVDISMKSEAGLDEYFAQDFWVFAGQYLGYGLPYLEDTLMAGGEAVEVASVLGDSERLNLYWEWAKNQAMEKTFNFDGILGTPCQIENQVINTPEIFQFDFFNKISHDVVLGPLNSLAVEIKWDFPYDLAAGIVFPYDPSQQPAAGEALEYKFYKNGEGGCQGIPEGPRNYENVDPGEKYYVLISNTDVKKTFLYRVFFEVAPIPTR